MLAFSTTKVEIEIVYLSFEYAEYDIWDSWRGINHVNFTEEEQNKVGC